MKNTLFLFIAAIVLILTPAYNNQGFHTSRLEMNQSLRVDFILSGNSSNQEVSLFRLCRDQGWYGSPQQLISPFNYGEYRYFLIHARSGDTLYSKGFSTLFEEWRTTNEAKYKTRAFQQTLVMPFPRENSRIVIEGRKRDGAFTLLLDETINPKQIDLNKPARTNQVIKILHGDDLPAHRADLLIIAEGYSMNELDLFETEARKLTKALLNTEPYKSLQNHITIRSLGIPSPQSGVTDPLSGKWIDTYFKSRFNTFDTDRYLQTMETWKVYETAALAPYDHIIILVNSKKYGGGGIYNHFTILTSRNSQSADLLLHELGHGLAGLGDEYYNSEVAYDEFFNTDIEPWQPNLTTLVDFDRKWKSLIKPSIPVPTPEKPQYEYETGAFEGGGYVAKKVYRPAINCKMKSLDADNFCQVCSLSIANVIKFYTY